MKITHILFDLDGTLVNTVDTIINIVERFVAEHNRQMIDEIRDFVPNMTSYRSLLELINKRLDLQVTYDEFRDDFMQKYYDSDIKLMPGVERLVKHFHQCNLPMAIATGNSSKFCQIISQKFEDFFPKYFQHCVSAFDDPDVTKLKPAPDVYHVACKRFPIQPECMKNVLIFEDSMTGLKGALASGAYVVFVSKNANQIQTDEHRELVAKAHLRLETLEQFDPSKFSIPSFSN